MKKKVRLPLIIASLLLVVATSALFGTYWNVIRSGLQRGGVIITTLLDDLYQPESQKMDETALEHAIKHLDPAYYCPMHPQVTSDKPGRCPICGMDLVSLASTESGSMAGTGERKILSYRHPMNPDIISETPQKDSMGMDFIPIYADETQDIEPLIMIAPEVVQNLGVRTEQVMRATLSRRIDTVGYVGYNESLISHVHLRTEGWIEHLAVNTIGDRVARGDLLFTLYSPTLVNAQEEFLQVQERGNERLINASRQKLKALGVSTSQIDTLAQTRKAERTISVFAQHAGVVMDLKVREGMYVEPATETMTLVDLVSIWLLAEVFERQAAWVEVGQQAEARIPSMPERTWKGSVDFIYPDLDPVTRTLKVRLRFENPDEVLKPNMFTQVSLFASPRVDVITVPREAVIRDGEGERVILALGEGRFMPRTIVTGIESDGRVEILEGLADGDQVVVSAQFLLDSEASLKASFQRMTPMEKRTIPPLPPSPLEGHGSGGGHVETAR